MFLITEACLLLEQIKLFEMEIPYQKLDPDVLRGVITEYVTREGSDYGDRVYSLDEKIAVVQLQLEQGLARIVFDAKSETCNIVNKH